MNFHGFSRRAYLHLQRPVTVTVFGVEIDIRGVSLSLPRRWLQGQGPVPRIGAASARDLLTCMHGSTAEASRNGL